MRAKFIILGDMYIRQTGNRMNSEELAQGDVNLCMQLLPFCDSSVQAGAVR